MNSSSTPSGGYVGARSIKVGNMVPSAVTAIAVEMCGPVLFQCLSLPWTGEACNPTPVTGGE